jgi:DNA-binding XRE family transcriptional regulator
MIPEIINKNGQDYAIISFDLYQKLIEDAEMLSDIEAFDLAKSRNEETFPSEVVYSIIFDGENPIQVYRQYRNLTRENLADQVNISVHLLTEIEQNINLASLEILQAIADIFNVDLDMITPKN